MQDPHLELVILLQDKESPNTPTTVNSIKEMIRSVADRLRLGSAANDHLDAAFAYYVSGYYVRATRLISQAHVDDGIHPAQRWLALLIAKQFGCIEDQVADIVADERYYDANLAQAISHQGLSDAEVVDRILVRRLADTMDRFVQFVKAGDQTKLDEARVTLALCQQAACRARESRWWWWIECIRLVIAEFAENCLWTQLRTMRQESGADQIVSKYIVANYERSSPVVELWRTQTESLSRINDPERHSFCLSIPTGGGKTRVAELAILRFFLDYREDPYAKCVYIAPLRKLANEVEQTLSPVFTATTGNPRVVSSFYGGQEIDLLDQDSLSESRVLIVTPEKLDGMLRHAPELHSRIRLVIADEGHMIGDDSQRGHRYRMLLERLVYLLRIKSRVSESARPRLLFVSGVLPNAHEFAELITGDRSNVVRIDWRPLDEPLIDFWEWNGRGLASSSRLLSPPVLFTAPDCSSPDGFEDAVVRAAFTLALSSPTMVFSASKKAIESDSLLALLECLLDRHSLGDNPLPSELPIRSSFERYYSLLAHGVAVHHGGLPMSLRNETETRIYDGRIRLLFASPTLAQGVNVPFDSVLIYRLQHHLGNRIYDAAFWNVVGRVGRPIRRDIQSSTSLRPPSVVLLRNTSSEATKEDKLDIHIGRDLIKQEGQYRVASPFLRFLNKLREEWGHSTGRVVADLVEWLAERPDLQCLADRNSRSELSKLLRLLDEHLVALVEESELDAGLDDWLQARSGELVDLLVQATTIDPDDLDFIKEAVLARMRFIARHIPQHMRRQDYLLGLPLGDCERIRENQDKLLRWYCGCTDIFAGRLQSGLDNLVHILDFVWDLSICPREWRRNQIKPSPLFGWTMPSLWRSWIRGEDTQSVASMLSKLKLDADFDEFQDKMLAGSLTWGLSAVCRLLDDIARQRGLALTKDLEFLPSLLKHGVPGRLHCYLVKLRIPRDAATKIAELYVARRDARDGSVIDSFRSMHEHALEAIRRLTEGDIISLDLSNSVVDRIKERGIIKSCGLARVRKMAYPCWGHHTPTAARGRRKDTPWTRVPQMTSKDKSPKSCDRWTNWPAKERGA